MLNSKNQIDNKAIKLNNTDITNKDFVDAVFHTLGEGAHVWGTSFTSPPDKASNGVWKGGVIKNRSLTRKSNYTSGEANTFYTVSSMSEGSDGVIKRSKVNFDAAHVVTLDDIGDGPSAKIRLDKVLLPGSFVIETSPNNCQVGYILVNPVTDADYYNRTVDALIHQGLASKNDPGMKGVTRYVRMPVGTNNKTKYNPPHRHVLMEWHPDLQYSLQDLIDAYGLVLAPPAAEKSFIPTTITANDDPYLKVLTENGHVLTGVLRGDTGRMIDILCPFNEEHTDRKDEGAVYFLGGNFNCFHGHCKDRTSHECRQKLGRDYGLDNDELDLILRAALIGSEFEVLTND
jgi:hypothetical protein